MKTTPPSARCVSHSIEILEARIAPAAMIAANKLSATYSDVDGDLVTIKYTQPVADQIDYQFNKGTSAFGATLTGLDFTAALFKPGLGVSLTAKPQILLPGGKLHGDGLANIGFFNAFNDDLGVVSVAGDVAKIRAGSGSTFPAIKSLTVQSIGEYGLDTGAPNILSVINGALGSLTVKGNVRHTFNATTIGPVTIGGSLLGSSDANSGSISGANGLGAVKIAGSIIAQGSPGNDASGDGSAGIFSGGLIKSVTVGGSIIGGVDPDPSDATSFGSNSGSIAGEGIGFIKIGHDLVGGSAPGSGQIQTLGPIPSISIGGSLLGGAGHNSGRIFSAMTLAKITIGGDLRGGDANGYDLVGTGAIEADRIGSLTVGGSIIAGKVENGGTLVRSGFVNATHDLGSVVVRGSLVGNADNLVRITASGEAAPTPTRDLAMKSVFIGGNVDHAWILGGVDEQSVGNNATAQIGTVTVRGDWTASFLGTGLTSTDGYFGDKNDAPLGIATISKIATIVIGGQVAGQVMDIGATSGFAAPEIGSFRYHGIALALTPGSGNDTFALNNAHPVGPTRSQTNADTYAVHVYEVAI